IGITNMVIWRAFERTCLPDIALILSMSGGLLARSCFFLSPTRHFRIDRVRTFLDRTAHNARCRSRHSFTACRRQGQPAQACQPPRSPYRRHGMKVIVLGAGIVGMCSAYALRQAGMDVVVV